jgi:hypothetical protein
MCLLLYQYMKQISIHLNATHVHIGYTHVCDLQVCRISLLSSSQEWSLRHIQTLHLLAHPKTAVVVRTMIKRCCLYKI